MTLVVKSRTQRRFASVWLKDSCTVYRVTGYGTNSTPVLIASGVKYKHDIQGSPGNVSIDGGFKVEVAHILKFAVGQDIRTDDVIVDETDSTRFKIDADASGSFQLLQTFTAVEQQDSG